jgi:hypothetical protein
MISRVPFPNCRSDVIGLATAGNPENDGHLSPWQEAIGHEIIPDTHKNGCANASGEGMAASKEGFCGAARPIAACRDGRKPWLPVDAHAEGRHKPAALRLLLLPRLFGAERGSKKAAPKGRSMPLISLRKIGAGDGSRTHYPNLGKAHIDRSFQRARSLQLA